MLVVGPFAAALLVGPLAAALLAGPLAARLLAGPLAEGDPAGDPTATGAAPGAAAITAPGDATGGSAICVLAVGLAAAKVVASCWLEGLLLAVCAGQHMHLQIIRFVSVVSKVLSAT